MLNVRANGWDRLPLSTCKNHTSPVKPFYWEVEMNPSKCAKITPVWLNLSTGRWRQIHPNVESLQRRCYHEIKFIFSGSFIKLTGGLYLWITVTQLLVKLMSLLTGTLIICPWHVLRICINNASLEIFSVPSEDREAPKTHVVMMMAPAGIILICLPNRLNPAAPGFVETVFSLAKRGGEGWI